MSAVIASADEGIRAGRRTIDSSQPCAALRTTPQRCCCCLRLLPRAWLLVLRWDVLRWDGTSLCA